MKIPAEILLQIPEKFRNEAQLWFPDFIVSAFNVEDFVIDSVWNLQEECFRPFRDANKMEFNFEAHEEPWICCVVLCKTKLYLVGGSDPEIREKLGKSIIWPKDEY